MSSLTATDLADALLESEHRYRQLTESLPQLVWTCSADGQCDYLSPQWVAYTGIPADIQPRFGWAEQIHPEDRAPVLAAWTAAFRSGEPYRFQYRLRRHDGQFRWFESRALPLRDGANQIVKWFGTSTDIHEARETRAALEAEQQRLANLIALAPAVFCSYCLRPDGTSYFPYTSPGILDLFGVEPADLTKDAAHIFALFHSDDLPRVEKSIAESARTMSPWTDEFRISHPEKGERWIEGRSTPARSGDGATVWHGFLTDISERKQIEADQRFLLDLGAAMQSATTPAAIAQSATQIVADYFALSRCSISAIDVPGNEANLLHEHTRDACMDARSGKYPLSMWGSPHWLGVLGAGSTIAVSDTATNPITAPFFETAFRLLNLGAIMAVPLRRQGEWVAVLSMAAQQPRNWSRREVDLARAAAERIWPAYDSARALAAERTMHETLAANEERLRLALGAASIGIWERDLINGGIHWDARAREIFGLPADFEMEADALVSCVHPEDRPGVRQKADASRDPAGDGHFEMEYRIYSVESGSLRHIYSQGRTFFEGVGSARRAVRAIGTLQDITALKQGERALLAANKELEEFAYVASHDLKAPLRVISNAALWLAQDLAPHLTAETREHIALLHSRVRRMDKLLDDLLEYARVGRDIDEDQGEVIGADILIDNVLALLSPNGFTINVSPNFAAIRVPRMPLQQILLNLIGNAIKHHDKQQGCIDVTVEDAGPHYAFAVRDDGPGIPARFHKQIFEMFQTLRPRDRVEGSGMGLAMVRKNIEVFGGTIQLDSAEGAGSTFRFTWPKRAQPTEKKL